MENLDGVWFDGAFYYKNLGNQIKLSWQQFNHNLETIKNVSENIDDQLNAATQSAGSALASQRAAAVSATEALNAKTASEAAKDLSEEANTSAQAAKNTAVSAKDAAVSANTTAQGAKTAAELARNDSVAARNIAQTSATTATSAKNAAETARNTATQKAAEANQSAIDAEYWAGLSEESAGEVTSVQGKKGKVDLKRVDFSWMGDAAERNVTDDPSSIGKSRLPSNAALARPPLPTAIIDFNEIANTHRVNGLYPAMSNVGSVNAPPSGGGFHYYVYQIHLRSQGNCTQIAYPYRLTSESVYIRTRYQNVWTGWILQYDSHNLPQATQAELNAGTQTAPRLFSPKQLADNFYSVSSLPTATQAEIDEGLESEPRLFSPKQLVDNFKPNIYEVFTESGVWVKPKGVHAINAMIVGGGGGRRVGSPSYDGANGGYMVVTIPLSHLPEGTVIDVIVGSGGNFGQAMNGSPGGDSSFLDFESEGGSGGRSGLVGSGGNNFRLVTANESLVPAPGYPMGNPAFSTRTEGRGVGGTASSPVGSPGIVKIWT